MRLWSTLPKLQTLRRPLTMSVLKRTLERTGLISYRNLFSEPARIHGRYDLVTVAVDAVTGKKTVTGNMKNLKKSAAYPLQFGLALASIVSPRGEPNPVLDG